MKTIMCAALVDGYPRGSGASAPSLPGEPLPGGAFSPATATSGVMPVRRLTAPVAELFTGHQRARKQDNSMTRIAAAGGKPGPHPEWDPV